MPPAGVEELDPAQLAPGFRAGGAHCGLKGGGKTDVGLIVCDAEEVSSAVLLTRNASAAAPVRVIRERCEQGSIRAAVVNAGNANAETGEQGYADAVAMCDEAAAAAGAEARDRRRRRDRRDRRAAADRGCPRRDRRGRRSPLCRRVAIAFSEAILTTDRWPKRCTLRAGGVTISAQAKGGGMIQPNMATMLCFVQTDAVVDDPDAALRAAVDASFERITVDGQMSTNDTVCCRRPAPPARRCPRDCSRPSSCSSRSRSSPTARAPRGSAGSQVDGAASAAEAERVARAIANSPLVKTALFGRDPNWGRIAQAAGMALAGEDLEEIGAENIDNAELAEDIAEAEIGLRLDRGEHSAHVWFSDLGYEYVRINAEYTT